MITSTDTATHSRVANKIQTGPAAGKSRTIRTLFASLCALLLVAGCGLFAPITTSVASVTTQATTVLDQLINSLNVNSTEWRSLVEAAISELPTEETTLIEQLNGVISDAENGAGKVVQCSEAFVGKSVLYDVQSIRAIFLHETPPAPPPTVCSTDPVELDPSNLASNPRTIKYFGFNFKESPLKETLVASNGTTADVSSKLFVDSEFSLHVDLGGLHGIPVTTSDSRLDLITTNGTYSVTFNPPGIPACILRTGPMDPPPGTVTLIASHIGGDANWGGNGPAITITTQTEVWPNVIMVTVTFDAQETGGDQTADHISGALVPVYRAPAGYAIQPLSNTLFDGVSYTHTGSSSLETPIARGNDSIVNSYQVNLGEGNLAADNTTLTLTFNPLNVTLFGPPIGSQGCSNPVTPPSNPPPPPTPHKPTPVPPPRHAPCPFIKPQGPPPGEGGC